MEPDALHANLYPRASFAYYNGNYILDIHSSRFNVVAQGENARKGTYR